MTQNLTRLEVEQGFMSIFKETNNLDLKTFFSPGRINLIGEHTDYNGGYVFPAAISYGTYAVAKPRQDNKVRLFSANFEQVGIIDIDLQQPIKHSETDHWAKYVKGVIWAMQEAGYNVGLGFDAYIQGDIPNSAGLSSSASLELLTCEILSYVNNLNIDMVEKVKISQKAENQYVGVMCGIMDQFAIGMGKKGHAIRLNTNDLSYQYAKADLGAYCILIMNTNKPRALSDSAYNERRAECEKALSILQKQAQINHLCDLSPAEFEQINNELKNDSIPYKRAKHCITENQRVMLALQALEKGDLTTFGELLNQSHSSLKEDYEVTGTELDTIVHQAQNHPSVLGARMTGAGFGGCAIALVKQNDINDIQQKISQGYTEAVGYKPSFYISNIGDGARML